MVKIGSKCFKHGHCAPLFFPVRCPYHDPAPTTPDVAHQRTSCSVCAALIRSLKPYPFPILSFFLELGLS